MPSLDLIAWLILVLWGTLLFGGLIFGGDPKLGRRMPRRTRMGSSMVLVGLAWYGWALATLPASRRYALLIAAGMTLGFVGDLLLAGLIPVRKRMLAGMTAFGLCHVLYIAAIVGFRPVQWGAWILWLILGSVLYYAIVFRGQERSFLQRAAIPYALLLSSTAGAATGLALNYPIFWGLATGAVFFLISDLLLAVDLFSDGRLPYLHDLVWLIYGPGQMLIVVSIWGTFRPFV